MATLSEMLSKRYENHHVIYTDGGTNREAKIAHAYLDPNSGKPLFDLFTCGRKPMLIARSIPDSSVTPKD